MKKLIMLSLVGLFFVSCSKDNSRSSNSLSETPDAKPQYDNSNYGIYKGVFTGSTGIVTININNDSSISARLIIDGTTYNFTTTESVSLNESISDLTFTNGSLSFDFSVSPTGNNPSVSNIVFSEHPNATIAVLKEHSNSIVKCYEGRFAGSDSGVFNAAISDIYIYGLGKSNNDGKTGAFFGTIINNTIDASAGGVTKISGILNGDNISGTWPETDNSNENKIWTGRRTL